MLSSSQEYTAILLKPLAGKAIYKHRRRQRHERENIGHPRTLRYLAYEMVGVVEQGGDSQGARRERSCRSVEHQRRFPARYNPIPCTYQIHVLPRQSRPIRYQLSYSTAMSTTLDSKDDGVYRWGALPLQVSTTRPSNLRYNRSATTGNSEVIHCHATSRYHNDKLDICTLQCHLCEAGARNARTRGVM